MMRRYRYGAGVTSQSGVTLIVAMVVLVVIGLASAAVMRGALSSDLAVNNTRVQSLASQAAQVALKYCESQVVAPTPAITILAAPGADEHMAWELFANWSNAGMVNDIPVEFVKSELSSFGPAQVPQCIAQRSVAGTANVIVITARGFSPDYDADDAGNTETGSVVWMQYILAVS